MEKTPFSLCTLYVNFDPLGKGSFLLARFRTGFRGSPRDVPPCTGIVPNLTLKENGVDFPTGGNSTSGVILHRNLKKYPLWKRLVLGLVHGPPSRSQICRKRRFQDLGFWRPYPPTPLRTQDSLQRGFQPGGQIPGFGAKLVKSPFPNWPFPLSPTGVPGQKAVSQDSRPNPQN